MAMTQMVDKATTKAHPWSKRVRTATTKVTATEFVIDNMFVAGAVAIAGHRGLGKTSCLVPIFMNATKLLTKSCLQSTITRRVLYVTEDPMQVRLIIEAMYIAGYLNCSKTKLDDMFHIIHAERINPTEIRSFLSDLSHLKIPNKREDGSTYEASPVIVLDTINATLQLDSINDNAEVSRALSTIRSGLADIPIVLIGHTSKAQGSRGYNSSVVGAGAWENDTQQTAYLHVEAGTRLLTLGKTRFDRSVTDYEVMPETVTINTENKLGQQITTRVTFGIAVPFSMEKKQKLVEAAKQKKTEAKVKALQDEMLRVIRRDPGISVNTLKDAVAGAAAAKTLARRKLEAEGLIFTEQQGRKLLCYPAEDQ